MSTDLQIAFVNGFFMVASIGAIWLVFYMGQNEPSKKRRVIKPVDNEPRWVKRDGKWVEEQ